MNKDIYNVDKYTDAQLYDVLDMTNPTDRELEAKIIHLIQKYTNMQTESGNELADFFNNIYKRFFKTDSDEEGEDDTQEEITEGFENRNSKRSLQKEEITAVQSFDYAQDKLQINPLIKQTITRVISIDSQYRDVATSPMTTNFTFDLSEPLKDVVSLKLYSIQIPYTWYTISKSYGSNFFYLKPTNMNLYYNKYSYKIEIQSGTYTSTQLIIAVNNAFQDISNNAASDVNFNGLPILSYNTNTAKTTINLNMQNVFNENYYYLNFPTWTSPNTIPDKYNSIPGYLGFNETTYYPNSIITNTVNTSSVSTIINSQQNYVLTTSNNYFNVIQYTNAISGRQNVLQNIKVYLTDENGIPLVINSISRTSIITAVNNGLAFSGYFDTYSGIKQIDISNNLDINDQKSYFQLSIIFNRYKIKYVPNAKTSVIFPTETPQQNNNKETYTIWTNTTTTTDNICFPFDLSTNLFSSITAETPYTNVLYSIDTSANIYLKCISPGYTTLNDISLNIPTGNYVLTQYINAITNSFLKYNTDTQSIFNVVNTKALLDITNTFNLQIDITIPFRNTSYQVYIDQTYILASDPFSSFPTSTIIAGNPITGSVRNTGGQGYLITNPNILQIQPIVNNKNSGNILIKFPQYNGYDISPAHPHTFANIDVFMNAIITAITTYTDTTTAIIQQPFSASTISYQLSGDGNTYSIVITINCYLYLSESDYTITFSDGVKPITDAKNAWQYLHLNTTYNLVHAKETDPYSTIIGNAPITDATITILSNNNSFTLSTISTFGVPSDNITVSITPGTYTINTLYSAINTAFSANPKTIGSTISPTASGYTQIYFNINNIFTTADYMLSFYDPVSFITCFAGSSSIQNTTWDTTVGWILGFRDYTQYNLLKSNQVQNTNFPDIYYYLRSTTGLYLYSTTYTSNTTQLLNASISITGDTTLNTNLFNYFLISLDDYIQNHLNDGLVTITRNQTAIQMQEYQYSTKLTCDPGTNKLIRTQVAQQDSNNATANQIYAFNQSIISQQNQTKQYSAGPFIKDLFGIVPIKVPNNPGDTYTEFGGTLQNQTRVYFGPVNIRKMSIQLLTDRGDLVDLNGSNWTFSFVCEQLYRSSNAAT